MLRSYQIVTSLVIENKSEMSKSDFLTKNFNTDACEGCFTLQESPFCIRFCNRLPNYPRIIVAKPGKVQDMIFHSFLLREQLPEYLTCQRVLWSRLTWEQKEWVFETPFNKQGLGYLLENIVPKEDLAPLLISRSCNSEVIIALDKI